MVSRLLGAVDEQASKLERQKLRAVGLRNRATAEAGARRRLEAGHHAAVGAKKETLDRLAREHESLRKAIAAKPDFGKAWANLGVALASGGDLDAAEEPFRNAVNFEPSARNWINLAKLHAAKGQTELANDAMGKARSLGGI